MMINMKFDLKYKKAFDAVDYDVNRIYYYIELKVENIFQKTNKLKRNYDEKQQQLML